MNVLLLGAGASLGARHDPSPSTKDEPLPPLGGGLAGYLQAWMQSNELERFQGLKRFEQHLDRVGEALARVARREMEAAGSGTAPFEELMNGWSRSNDHRPCLLLTQTLMAYSMIVGTHCAFAEHSDRLDSLLAQEDPSIVITVNYDTLVEEALQRLARRYCAPLILDDGKLQPSSLDLGSVTSLFKLHGSVSWLSMHEGGAGSDFGVSLREAEQKQTLSVGEARFGRVPQTFSTKVFHDRSSLLGALDPRASRVEAPVLAVYGQGKHLLNNPHHMQSLRDECLRRLRDPSSPIDRVVAVGIRFPSLEDDEVLREVIDELAKRGREKYYVSPSTSDCDAFQKLGFSTKAPTLTEFLNCEKPPSSA